VVGGVGKDSFTPDLGNFVFLRRGGKGDLFRRENEGLGKLGKKGAFPLHSKGGERGKRGTGHEELEKKKRRA